MSNNRAVALKNFKTGLDQRAPEFARALPPQIPPERFTRVALTAVQNNPDLLDCSPQSVFNACMKAAQDGLLPDGREGAIVKYGSEAQWMPMVAGIRKKARNSGEIASIIARVVLKGEDYRYWIDEDGEHLRYEPSDEQVDIKNLDEAREKVRLVFAMSKLKDGTLVVEPMTVDQVARVQLMSKAKKEDSPWKQWWGEMAKKTAIRRLSKSLPMSSDLDDLIRRDDELYSFDDKPAPRVVDMDAASSESLSLPPPPPPDGEGKAAADNGDAPARGSDAAPSPSDTSRDAEVEQRDMPPPLTQLESEIANNLADARTHPDCEAVRKLFQKEIIDAPEYARERISKMIAERKEAISRENDESFPGAR